ncbi:MAG: hypothetical protein AVDCRST_MAG18-2422 [uncultured Thermomicrobiales bacterium]|uniref:Uncharacterized protein n=1 Tax=uncultured Thermomicrobiales bacterium TaxID=1645740 RepID=A0A6J4VBL9_9BACT|nr:MAG: hypothetical protein AVDCRST_MAG18-2422 [uncultured Thermomicrobiales bacterium]
MPRQSGKRGRAGGLKSRLKATAVATKPAFAGWNARISSLY